MKYENYENNEINNLHTENRDADGVVIPTNALDFMMKQYLGTLEPIDYVLSKYEVNVGLSDDGIRTLQSYLLDMRSYIDTDTMNEDGGYDDDPRETQILKGFKMLLALYDVMNRDVINQRNKTQEKL